MSDSAKQLSSQELHLKQTDEAIDKLLNEPLKSEPFIPANETEDVAYRLSKRIGELSWNAFSTKEVLYETKLDLMDANYRANHDSQTGLVRKEIWEEQVEEKVAAGKPFAVVFMDMDALKRINDTVGHQAGDTLISSFGAFMNTRFRRSDDSTSYLTGRLGGDEFGTIINLDENDRRATDPSIKIDNAVQYLKDSLNLFVKQQSDVIKNARFNVSTGVAIFDPKNPVSAEKIIEMADHAMYSVKKARKAFEKQNESYDR